MASADSRTPADRRVTGVARLLRGWGGALAMTLLAALFHAAALPGHAAPGLPVLAASTVLAAPLCTALAGRMGSAWRLAAAVTAAQGLFHTVYGLAGRGHDVALAPGVGAHAAHGGLAATGAPVLTTAAPAVADGATTVAHADPRMVLAHVVAALLTVAVLRRGESAVLAIVERVVEAALILWTRAVTLPTPAPARRRGLSAVPRLSPSLLTLSSPGRRGPPSYVLAA